METLLGQPVQRDIASESGIDLVLDSMNDIVRGKRLAYIYEHIILTYLTLTTALYQIIYLLLYIF